MRCDARAAIELTAGELRLGVDTADSRLLSGNPDDAAEPGYFASNLVCTTRASDVMVREKSNCEIEYARGD